MSRTLFILLFFQVNAGLFAQKEANFWYFGEKAGLDFSSGIPLAISNGQLSTVEGCATVSNKNGELLFYTDGQNVWNRNHQMMSNGNALMGGSSSTQSAIVVPFPGNDSLYYIFTTAQENTPYGLRYSIVNMKKDNGLGDIISKNVLLLDNVYEKVSAVKKINCPEYWVVAKRWDSDEYYSFLVSSSGIGSPIVSKTGNFTGGPSEYSRGQMKFSPDGTKLAVAYNVAYDFFELMKFDQATGILSNPIKLTPNLPPTEIFSVGAYGVEFSPNSQLLYVAASYLFSTPKLFTIYQYNVSYNDPSQVIASKKLINGTEFNYGMQVGPDKKIYIATYDNYLNSIDNPDIEGAGCGFSIKSVSLTGSSKASLPSFIQSFFKDPIIATGNCEFQNINFSIQNSTDLSYAEWDFGDLLSGPDNTSLSFTPAHIYSQQGTYKVRLVYLRNGGCFNDTVYKQIYAGPFKLYLGKDTSICERDTLQLHAKIPNASLLWSDGSTDTLIKVIKTGQYWVRATLNSCWATDTIQIYFKNLPNFSLGKDTAICVNSDIVLSPQPNFSNVSYYWSNDSTTVQVKVNQPGIYWLTVTDSIGCKATDSVTVSLKSLPEFNLGKDTILCQTTLQLNAAVPGAAMYQWNTGENTPSISIDQKGTYWAQITKDDCIYRDSINVEFKPYPAVNLGKDTVLCEGISVLLDAQNIGSTYSWQDNSTNQTYEVTKQGKYWVKVVSNGCAMRDTIVIKYDLKPVFNLGNDTAICNGQTLQLKPQIESDTGISWLWDSGSTNSTLNINQPGEYILKASNTCGSRYDTIEVFKGVCKLYIPNAFTPNNDGRNDIFKPSFGENIIQYSLEIYNRWGSKIFNSKNLTNGWDGKLNGVLQPADAYVWLIRYKNTNNPKEYLLKGTLMLIR